MTKPTVAVRWAFTVLLRVGGQAAYVHYFKTEREAKAERKRYFDTVLTAAAEVGPLTRIEIPLPAPRKAAKGGK